MKKINNICFYFVKIVIIVKTLYFVCKKKLISSENLYFRQTVVFSMQIFHVFVGVTAQEIKTKGRTELKILYLKMYFPHLKVK